MLARQRNLLENHSRDLSLEVRFELLGGLNVVMIHGKYAVETWRCWLFVLQGQSCFDILEHCRIHLNCLISHSAPRDPSELAIHYSVVYQLAPLAQPTHPVPLVVLIRSCSESFHCGSLVDNILCRKTLLSLVGTIIQIDPVRCAGETFADCARYAINI